MPLFEMNPALQILLEFTWLVLIVFVDIAVNLPAPATSSDTPGAAIPMPTLLLVLITIAGVTLLGTAGYTRALTPGSNTIEPVVCMRIRSEADEPLKIKSSWRPLPVDCSATTLCAYPC